MSKKIKNKIAERGQNLVFTTKEIACQLGN